MPNNDGVIAAYGNTLSKSTAGDTMAGPLTCSSTLAVAGASTLAGNVAVGGNLAVTGAITYPGSIPVQSLSAGYAGQSLPPEVLPSAALTLTTAYGYLTRVNVTAAATTSYLDVVFTSTGAVTNAVWALYSATAANPLAYTAEAHLTVTGAAGLYSIPWTAPVALMPGLYYIFQEVTGTAPAMPAVTAPAAAVMNAGTALASGTLNSALLATGAPTAVTGSTQLAFGTSWAQSASKIWYGLR